MSLRTRKRQAAKPPPTRARPPRRMRPHVLVNMAMSADGKIATANRKVSSFGSARDQKHLYELRATADAVLAGARTVDLNQVTMGPGAPKLRQLRLRRGLAEYNLRVIVSGSGSINPRAEIFRHRFSPILVITTGRASVARLKHLRKVADEVLVCGTKDLDLVHALEWLWRRWKIRRLVCEGGGELNAALFAAGLVDEVRLTICPRIIGGRNAPTIADGAGSAALQLARQLQFVSVRRVADELFLAYQKRGRSFLRNAAPPELSSNKRRMASIQPPPKPR